MDYRGTVVEGPKPPRCQEDANPCALWWIALTEGVRPLKMTSFLWIQRGQSVAKIVCHSALRQNVPLLRDRRNASSEDGASRLTLAAWAKGPAKNKCEQSSTAPTHSEHSTGESRAMRCRRDLVIRRHLRRSQANTLILRGRRRFHTSRLRCKRSGSSESSWSCNSLYAP